MADKHIDTVLGTVEAFPAFERKTELLVSPSMSEIREKQSHVQITNHLDHAIIIPRNTTIAVFKHWLQTKPETYNQWQTKNWHWSPNFQMKPTTSSIICSKTLMHPQTNDGTRHPEHATTPTNSTRSSDAYLTKSSNSEKLKSLTPHVMTSNDRRSSRTSAGMTQFSMSKSNRDLKHCWSNTTWFSRATV